MKITDIKQQVKRQGRYSIFIDGSFRLGLSESALVEQSLRIGQELTDRQLADLTDVAQADKAFSRLLDLIARRPRSIWEARDYLRRKGYEEELIEQIVARVQKIGYLDDFDFARRWAESRRLLKPISSKKLMFELRQKRISDDIITQVLQQTDDDYDERAVLRELIARKQSRYPDGQKLIRYLAGQGFRYDDIKAVLADLGN